VLQISKLFNETLFCQACTIHCQIMRWLDLPMLSFSWWVVLMIAADDM
jgi:hypothetical protein